LKQQNFASHLPEVKLNENIARYCTRYAAWTRKLLCVCSIEVIVNKRSKIAQVDFNNVGRFFAALLSPVLDGFK